MDPIQFSFRLADFDIGLLPIDSNVLRNDPVLLSEAVKAYYQAFFKRAGGNLNVTIEKDVVTVAWIPAAQDEPEKLVDCAISLLQQGAYDEAEKILRPLQKRFPNNAAIMYNLGMMLSDKRRLVEALALLTRLTKLYPDHANGWIAVGVAHQRNQNAAEARKAFEKCLALEPENPYALRNLGALIANEDPTSSLPYLKRAAALLPQDQSALYGYGLALLQSGKSEEANTYFKKAIEIAPNTTIAELCKQQRTNLANQTLRNNAPGGLRMDAIMYCLGALERYKTFGPEKTQIITFEIAMLGRSGLDSSDPAQKYHLNSLSGSFSGLQLVCMMYVGFKQIAPELDTGFDLSKEYAEAAGIFKNKGQTE